MKYWWIIVIIVIIGLSTFGIVLTIKLNNLSDTNQLQAVELSTLKDSVSTYIDKNGELVSKLESVEIEKSNLKESLNIAGYDVKDLKAKNIKWRKLNDILKFKLESAGSGSVELNDTIYITNSPTSDEVVSDTINAKTFKWSNDYLSLTGDVKDNRLSFDYIYKTDVKLFKEERRKETIVTVLLSDPQASVTSANSIIIKHKQKWWNKWYIWTAVGLTGGILIAK